MFPDTCPYITSAERHVINPENIEYLYNQYVVVPLFKFEVPISCTIYSHKIPQQNIFLSSLPQPDKSP